MVAAGNLHWAFHFDFGLTMTMLKISLCLFSGVHVRVQMLYQQGFDVKEGLVRFEVGSLTGGPPVAHYAFFDMSCYKFAFKTETRHKDLASVIPVCGNQVLRAHIVLVKKTSPVAYVCTALWNSNIWNRDPDSPGPNPPMDPLFMEKYENIVSKIVSASGASLLSVLPSPIPASTATPAQLSLQWASDELIKNRVGKVTNIIDGNYGIAVVRLRLRGPGQGHVRTRAIVLFDTCDVWVGAQTAQQLDRTLSQVRDA